jgi:hypothetical protein
MDNIINEYWNKTKEWFYNIKVGNNLFPINKIYKNKDKDIFIEKFIKLLKKLLTKDEYIKLKENTMNLSIKYEINDNTLFTEEYNSKENTLFTEEYNSKGNTLFTEEYTDNKSFFIFNYLYDIFNNIKKNTSKYNKKILNLLDFDNDLKNSIIFISKYSNYYKDIINKIKTILNPILNENNLFKQDDDLFRISAPIFFVFMCIYINNIDLKKSIQIFLECDTIFIIFFIVSYLILDDIMDDETINKYDKHNFMKWFINIVNNPNDKIIIPINNVNNNNLFNKYIIFKKYVEIFIDKYKPNEHIFIYNYIKYMVSILQESNVCQKNKTISEEKILEYSFKKSFSVSYFLIYFLNYHSNDETVENLSKLILLSQLIDDFSDIDKDKLENNYTYFNSNNIELSFDERIKKLIYACYDYSMNLSNLNKDLDINIFVNVFTKYNLLLLVFFQYNKINKQSLNEILKYQIIPNNIMYKLLKIYKNEYSEKIIIKILKNILSNV